MSEGNPARPMKNKRRKVMATKLEIHIGFVEEINDKLELDPPIPTDFDSVKELKKRIRQEMAKYDGQLFEFDEEKFSEETWEFLTEDLEIKPRPKKEWAKFLKELEKEAKEKAEEDESDPEEEDENGDEDEDEQTTTEKKKKGKDKDMADEKTGKKKVEGKKGKEEKTEKKTTTSKKEPKDLTKSNKAQVWLAWDGGKGETNPDKLHKLIKKEVKLDTIKQWLKAWERNDPRYLPAIAKQGKKKK
jgi:hypothetical protein